MSTFGVVEKDDVATYNELFEKWAERYFGKDVDVEFSQKHEEALEKSAEFIKGRLHLRMIALSTSPKAREERLQEFIDYIFKHYGVEYDTAKLAHLLNEYVDWSKREPAEWTVAKVLATFVVAYKLGVREPAQEAVSSKPAEEKAPSQPTPAETAEPAVSETKSEDTRPEQPAKESKSVEVAPVVSEAPKQVEETVKKKPEQRPETQTKAPVQKTLSQSDPLLLKESVFEDARRKLLSRLAAGERPEVKKDLLEEAKHMAPEAFLRAHGFSEKETRNILSSYPSLAGFLRIIHEQPVDLPYYVALMAQLREEIYGQRAQPPEPAEQTPEVKTTPPAAEPAAQEVKPVKEAPKPAVKAQAVSVKETPAAGETTSAQVQLSTSDIHVSRESYEKMMFIVYVINPDIGKDNESYYYLYSQTFLSIFNDMFGLNARSLEELKGMLKKDGDIQEWALDFIELIEKYGAQNLTLGDLKNALEKVDSLLTLTNEDEVFKQWQSWKEMEGINLALALRGLDRGYVNDLLSDKTTLAINPDIATLLDRPDMPVLARHALALTLSKYGEYILEHYRKYENEGGRLVPKDIESLAEVIDVVSNPVLNRHPLFYTLTLPALIETSRSLDALQAKVLTITAFVEGLERAPKYRGFNDIVVNDYLAYAAKTAYEAKATLMQDVKALILGEKGDQLANLTDYYTRQAEAIGKVGVNLSEDMSISSHLDLIGGIYTAATTDGFSDIIQVEETLKNEWKATTKPITPIATPYQPEYLVRGIATNLVPFTEYRPSRYVYTGNVWLGAEVKGKAEVYSGDISNRAGGEVIGKLVGTGSLIEGKLSANDNDLELNVVGKDLQRFAPQGVKNLDFQVTWDKAGVDAEVAAELDKLRGNVAIAYKGRGSDKEFYIYYKDTEGHWYRVGRVWGDAANQWIMAMDTYIPGFARMIADLKLDDKEGAMGVIGLEMGRLSVGASFDKDSFAVLGAYLLHPENLTVETILGKREIPQITYAGFVKGTVIAGGQTGMNDGIVAGDLALGNVTGLRLVYENADVSLQGVYVSEENNHSLAFQAVSQLGGIDWLVKYAATVDSNTIVVQGRKSYNLVQFMRYQRYTDFARAQYQASGQRLEEAQQKLVELAGDEKTANDWLDADLDSLNKDARAAVLEVKNALRTANTYSLFLTSGDFMSLLAENDKGFAELIRANLNGDIYIVNAAYHLNDTTQVGGTLGLGSGTILGGFASYSTPELAALLKIYLANLGDYNETTVKGLIKKSVEEGEWGAIGQATFKKLADQNLTQVYLGAYYDNQLQGWKVEVVGQVEIEDEGSSAALGSKIYYRISPKDEVPAWLTAEGIVSFGLRSGWKLSASYAQNNFEVKAFWAGYSGPEGSNVGWGVGAHYTMRFEW